MGETTTRPSLISRLRDPADAAAWSEFSERYGELILRWCRFAGLHQWDAEDVRQGVMLDLFRALGAGFYYRPERGRFRHYLGAMVRHAIARRGAGAGAAERSGDSAAHADGNQADGEDLDARWEEEWRDHHVRLALRHVRGTLAPRNQEFFERLLGGEPLEDAARALGLGLEAARKLKQRVLAQVRDQVREQILDEEHSDAD